MKKNVILSLIVVVCLVSACAQTNTKERKVGTRCEACELMFEGMPKTLSAETQLTDAKEPGEPITISGTIYKADGKTPAPGVILYVYHTDAKGLYSPSPNQKHGVRHGHIRGWMKTDQNGKYTFTSIRPASYPNGQAPQHIHPLIKEPGTSLYWIDEYLFDDDPLLSENEKSSQEKRGGPGIVHLTKNKEGVWVGKRDIVLGLNIPNY
jgi:protocatechuate 3,4-dioxygenase beta subunit